MIAEAPTALIRVVIADDSAGLRGLLRSTLMSDGGFEITGEAADGAEAVRVVVLERPDILLLDLAMPIMDGMETIPVIARLSPETRIAVLSSFDAAHSERQALRCGADVYISKRASGEEVVAALRGLRPDLGGPRATTPPATGAVETLLQAEDRCQTIVQEVTDYGIVMLDKQGNVESWNVGAERMTGYTADSIMGRPFATFFTGADAMAGKPERALARAATAGRYEGDERSVRRDGSQFWAHIVLNVLCDAEGRTRGFASVTQDITAAKHLSDSLRHQTAHLTTIIDNSLNGVVGMDERGAITTWSAQAERTFGWRRDEVLGRPLESTLVPVSLREAYRQWMRAYIASPETHATGTVRQVFALHRDGHEFPAELTISPPLQDQNGLLEFIGFVRDSSDRVRARRLRAMQFQATRSLAEASTLEAGIGPVLEAICDAMPCPMGALWLADERGRSLRLVRAWHQPGEGLDELAAQSGALELERDQDLPGAVWATEVPQHVVDLTAAGCASPRAATAIAAGLSSAVGFPVVHRGGVVGVIELVGREPFVVDDTAALVMQDLGHQIGQLLERVHAIRELREKADNLERSNNELEQFTRVASHDLQEPLRTISSYVQLLKRRYGGKLGEDADDYIEFAVDGATRMQALITDLLAFSRAARAVPEPADIDVADTVATARSNLQAALEESGGTVECSELPRIQADAGQLVQLFQNLIGNAIKFHGEGPPHVEISATRQDAAWRFSIRDHGIGIEPEHAEQVFEVFQRLHTREEYPGTGVGLALCRKVVERLGGSIWVESEPGQGSNFLFTVPDPSEAKPWL